MDGQLISQVADDLHRELQQVEKCIEVIRRDSFREVLMFLAKAKGRIFVTGVGTSGSVARRTAHLLTCCGVPALFIHPTDAIHGGSGVILSGDVIVAYSKGGKSSEINNFLKVAVERGAAIIGLTEDCNSEFGQICDYMLEYTIDPESEPFGMIATTSSLFVSVLSDALCIGLLRLRGYTKDQFATTHPGGKVGEIIKRADGGTEVDAT